MPWPLALTFGALVLVGLPGAALLGVWWLWERPRSDVQFLPWVGLLSLFAATAAALAIGRPWARWVLIAPCASAAATLAILALTSPTGDGADLRWVAAPSLASASAMLLDPRVGARLQAMREWG